MNQKRFLNAIKILLSIDLDELVNAKIIDNPNATSGTCWHRFNSDPLIFIAKLSDGKYDALWNLIETRQPSVETIERTEANATLYAALEKLNNSLTRKML